MNDGELGSRPKKTSLSPELGVGEGVGVRVRGRTALFCAFPSKITPDKLSSPGQFTNVSHVVYSSVQCT